MSEPPKGAKRIELGAAMRAARLAAGLRLEDFLVFDQFGRRHWDDGYLSKVETGKKRPSKKLVEHYEQTLDLDSGSLIALWLDEFDEARRRSDDDVAASKATAQPLRDLYPFSFADFPECLLGDGLEGLHILVGSTGREQEGDAALFLDSECEVELLGRRVQFRRQQVPGTVRDIVRIADFCAFLGQRTQGVPTSVLTELCVADVAVTKEHLRRNIIIVGGADTNVYFALATLAFEVRFGVLPAIRYRGDENHYFTCDEIVSTLSGTSYSRLEETGGMHAGYVLLCANPWSPDKVLLFVSGIRATGTQAALLSLILGRDVQHREGRRSEQWRSLSANNRFDAFTAGKVVRAVKARVSEAGSYEVDSRIHDVAPRRRIPQRHAIIDFVFEE